MIASSQQFVRRATQLSLGLLGIYLGVFLWIAARHILYPGFTLPIEGDILQHIEHVAHGIPLYPAPSPDFIPLAYMPFYYVVAAPFYLLFGDSFVGPRLLSSLCAVAAGVLIILITRKESQSNLAGYIAGALFFASYGIMDACLTSATTDSMMTLLVLAGYWFWAYGSSQLADLMWLLLFAMAFWTRQHGAFYFGFAVLYALLIRRNSFRRWVYVAALLLCGPVAYLTLGRLLGEGFFLHTWAIPARWEHSMWFSVKRLIFVIFSEVPLASVLTLFAVGANLRRGSWRISPLIWFLAGTVASVLVTMAAAGSSNNHYVPLLATLCITAALGVDILMKSVALATLRIALASAAAVSAFVTLASIQQFGSSHPIPHLTPFAVAFALAFTWIPLEAAVQRVATVVILIAGQFVSLAFNPMAYLPVPGYEAGIARLQREIASLRGELIWAEFGNAPAALTGMKIQRSSSWVAREDVERQIGADAEAERDLEPFHQRILSANGLYVLSNGRISEDREWNFASTHLQLVRDYGTALLPVQAISHPWYGGGEYPRFLYRLGPPSGQENVSRPGREMNGKLLAPGRVP